MKAPKMGLSVLWEEALPVHAACLYVHRGAESPVIRRPIAWRWVIPVAVAQLIVQVAFADAYGYHRDELYFRTAARHPAVAHDDQGAITPTIGWLSEALFGETPRGLRCSRP